MAEISGRATGQWRRDGAQLTLWLEAQYESCVLRARVVINSLLSSEYDSLLVYGIQALAQQVVQAYEQVPVVAAQEHSVLVAL